MPRIHWLPLLPHSGGRAHPHYQSPVAFIMSDAENGSAPRSLEELDLLRDATSRAWRRARRLLEEIRRREA